MSQNKEAHVGVDGIKLDRGPNKYEPTPPWLDIIHSYSQETTFHGVRFISAKTKYPIRRVLWLAAVTGAMSLFGYLMIERLIVYFSYPKSVSLEVTYKEFLEFPAVTICNQNLFRLSRIQQRGLYDDMLPYLDVTAQATGQDDSSDIYQQVRRGCVPTDYSADVVQHTYVEVTLSSCKFLCHNLHDVTCTIILFMPLLRSCILQPHQIIAFDPFSYNCTWVELYRRERVTDRASVFCNFESDCDLHQDSLDGEDWRWLQASLDRTGGYDHTTLSGDGHMFYMLESERPSESVARLITAYKTTNDLCVELYYWLRGPSRVTISVRGEDYVPKIQAATQYEVESDAEWQWLFASLPDGINQVIIEGIASGENISGILIDDVNLQPCTDFVKTCKYSPEGKEYLGTASISVSNNTCLNWTLLSNVTFPHGSASDNVNYCRAAAVESAEELLDYSTLAAYDKPWCLTTGGAELCDIPYCECASDYHLTHCDDGQCILDSVLCDGSVHCDDESDEMSLCEARRQVACDFSAPFICGYATGSVPRRDTSWIRVVDRYFFETTSSNATGHYLQIDTTAAHPQMLVVITTPGYETSTSHCLSFDYNIDGSTDSGQPQLSLYTRSTDYALTGDRLWTNSTNGWGTAVISVPADNTSTRAVLDFVGVVGDPSTTVINVANVQFTEGQCEGIGDSFCFDGEFDCGPNDCIQESGICDGNSDCMNESDERLLCTNSVSCDFNNTHLCGYSIRGTYNQFQWIRIPTFVFTDPVTPVHNDECGQVLTEAKGYVSSPNYPSVYDNNLMCTYEIIQQEGTTIEIQWLAFELEEYSCMYDFVQVFDTNGAEFGEYCGSVLPPTIVSTGNTLHLTFISDSVIPMSGFLFSYITHDGTVEPDTGFILAAHFSSIQAYASARTLALSPKETFSVDTCLTFRYFIRSNLLLMAINESTTNTLVNFGIDGGRAFHKAYIDLPIGRYQLLWEVMYDLDTVASSDEEYEIYRASLGDVHVHPGTCIQLRNDTNASIACDFVEEDVCGWKPVAEGPITWSRLRITDGDESFFGMATAWHKSETVFRLSTPTVDVYQESCLAVLFGCVSCGLNYRMQVSGHNISEMFEDLPPDNYWERLLNLPVGTYDISFAFYISAGYAVIRSTEMIDTRCGYAVPTTTAVLGMTTESATTGDGSVNSPTDELTTGAATTGDGSVSSPTDGLTTEAATTGDGSVSSPTDGLTTEAATTGDGSVSSPTDGLTTEAATTGDGSVSSPTDGLTTEAATTGDGSVSSPTDGLTTQAATTEDGSVNSPADGLTTGTATTGDSSVSSPTDGLTTGAATTGDGGVSSPTDEMTTEAAMTTIDDTTVPTTNVFSTAHTTSAELAIQQTTEETLADFTTGIFLLRDISAPNITDSQSVAPPTSNTTELVHNSTSGYSPADENATLLDMFNDMTGNTRYDKLSTNKNGNATDYNEPAYGLIDIDDVQDFYLYAAHGKEDFIYSCNWHGEKCLDVSINTTFTDLGLCYTFNADPNDIYITNKTGAGFGLSLVINIEQYEYVSGPNTVAGIKVYMHEQDDIPQIKNLGFAVSPGVHSLVSAQYSGLSSLSAPYGTCGESSMYMYDSGTKYTYSRCTEQCSAEYANETCGCVDAYMPGLAEKCNLIVYLDCLMKIEYVTGFHYSECVCPDACNVTSYGAELSYAALSTLSVDSLLDEDVTDLKWKYHGALEIQQRVLTEKMQHTIESLQNITTRLNVFTDLLINKSGHTLKRINTALYKINVLAQEDIGTMIGIINDYKTTFQSQMASKVGPVIFYMEHVAQSLNYLQHRVLGGTGDGAEHGRRSFQNAIEIMDTLNNSLGIMAEIEESPIDNPAYSRWYPHRVWSEERRALHCKELFLYEATNYATLQDELSTVIASWDLLSNSDTANTLQRLVWQRQQNVSDTIACAREYKDAVFDAHDVLDDIEADILTILNTRFSFVYDTALNHARDDIDYIKANITWMADCLKSYAENTTTKLKLAESITSDMAASIAHTLENILAIINTHAINPLQSRMANSRINTEQWLSNGLDALLPLVTYFDNSNPENDVRGLNIWREPFVDLDTLDILGFTYVRSETWRTWPRAVSLTELVQLGTGKTIISNILSIYHSVLHNETHGISLGLVNAMDEIVAAINVLVSDLNAFFAESIIGKDFILANFLKMDVYFSALKLVSVEQQESYGTLNFLSWECGYTTFLLRECSMELGEVGGYMGLLIGASTLTLCEVLDLVFYNLFLKCMDAGHRKRAVSVFVQPSKAPVDNTVTVEDLEDRYNKEYTQEYANDFVHLR